MRLVLLSLSLLVLGCSDAGPTPPPPQQEQPHPAVPAPGSSAKVVAEEVVDGDTFWTTWNGARKRVRLLGVDCPERELNDDDRRRFGEDLTLEGYRRSTEFLRGLVEGEEVELRFSVSGDQIDNTSSKRLLAYVHVGDTDVNAEICRQGYTYWYDRYEHDRREEFGGYVREAQEAGRGLWAP